MGTIPDTGACRVSSELGLTRSAEDGRYSREKRGGKFGGCLKHTDRKMRLPGLKADTVWLWTNRTRRPLRREHRMKKGRV